MTKEEFIREKKQIEEDIIEMLKETENSFTLEHIKDVIYNEEDSDDYQKIVAVFDNGGDISELNNILELVSNAWNYFPHKELGGLSPQEKLMEYEKNKL